MTWAGDDAGGSGVERYDVYVSVDGGDWTLWQDGTEETSADYEGTAGSSYAFYVHATDALGFANPVAPTAQAQTIAGVSFLVNISNRGGVGTGANIMIPGFVHQWHRDQEGAGARGRSDPGRLRGAGTCWRIRN